MPRGVSIHIGLNSVDPARYAGWSGHLDGAEGDAKDMYALATAQRFNATLLLTGDATIGALTRAVSDAAGALVAGDILLLSYSGHGGQLPDLNQDEDDDYDETWCLFDGEFVDDQVYDLLSRVRAGVRVLVISDSCHSGTVTRFALKSTLSPRIAQLLEAVPAPTPRAMPPGVVRRVYDANRATYDPILSSATLAGSRGRMAASCLLLSGCQDNQLSYDGPFNGAFTGALLETWRHGTFAGSYDDFHNAILARMPAYQTPGLFWATQQDAAFLAQRPFTI